ncbi:MAG TPA: phosphodiesterase [Solirubrobacterales bacterium]|nr:phosphodiesterase [Solirubrobacterales bacterium]
MSRPFILAQISDLHLGEPAIGGAKPKRCLREVIAAIEARPDPVDAVLVTGDIAEHGDRKEYALAGELIGALGVPFYVLPGNKDDRATMRRAFDLPGEGKAPLDYAVDLGALRLVVVDSTIPGEDRGDFSSAQLEWLDAELRGAPAQPTIVAMHQPPLVTGMADWDGVIMSAADRAALATVIERHPQVRALVGGHLHRIAAGALAGRPVVVAPSTFVQARPSFGAEKVKLRDHFRGFLLHVLRDGELSTQVEILASF